MPRKYTYKFTYIHKQKYCSGIEILFKILLVYAVDGSCGIKISPLVNTIIVTAEQLSYYQLLYMGNN